MKKILTALGWTAALSCMALLLPHDAQAESSSATVLAQAAEKIKQNLTTMRGDLERVAQQVSRVHPDAEKTRRLLLKLFQTNTYTVNCAFVDDTGKMLVVAPKHFAKFEGSDIGRQPQFQKMRRLKKPVFSSVFLSLEGFYAVDYEYPVFSSRKEWLGAVSMLLKPDAMLNRLMGPFAQQGAELWVLQSDGVVLYASDVADVGKNILQDARYQPYGEFTDFAARVCREPEGKGTFVSPLKGFGKPGNKEASWLTVAQDGMEWRIVGNAPFHARGA